jgi:ribosome-associated heat shock protein Hsp15
MSTDEPVRIDKWLWAVRVFKTRTIAAEECGKGRILINGNTVKPSHIVKPGEVIVVRKPPVIHTFKVLQLLKNRVSAQLVKTYLEDLTPEDELAKREMARLTANFQRDPGMGRPTKKDRRDLNRIWDED